MNSKKKPPLVSIIIATKNAETGLGVTWNQSKIRYVVILK